MDALIIYNIWMQQEQAGELKQIEIKDLTSALMSALGVRASSEGEKIQSATIFLSKLFRKYSPQAGKKFNEIKLNRLNGLLYRVCKEPPVDKPDIELIYQMVMCFLNNEGANPIDENSYASNTCVWAAKFIEEILASGQPQLACEAIDVLLKMKKPTLMSPDDFDRIITGCAYFKDREISKQDQTNANQKYTYRGFMSEYFVQGEIINKILPGTLFTNLYLHHHNKPEVIEKFLHFARQADIHNLKQLFVQLFVAHKPQTKQTLLAILTCLDSQLFTGEDLGQVFKLLLDQNDARLFYSLPIKNLKSQHRYLELLLENTQPNTIDLLAQAFISQKNSNNYYLIYLINKSNQRLSARFLTEPFQPGSKAITNRQAIICALAVIHNMETARGAVLRAFFDNESRLSNKQKLDSLRVLHFAYLAVPKSHLFTKIIRSVSVPALDEESEFEFLPRDNYDKVQLEKGEREELEDFLSRYFGNSDEVYWLKLNLYTLCGKMLACMQEFKKVQKIFEAPLDEIISDLPTISASHENLLEVVLMGINNKLDQQFIVNPNTFSNVLQWALDTFKREQKKFKTLVEVQLKKSNNQYMIELCLEVFYYNLDQGDNVEIDDKLNKITGTEVVHKLTGLNFSQYFMSAERERAAEEELWELHKAKNIMILLKRFIKMIKNDSKTSNRKELKSIVSDEIGQLRALKLIKVLSSVPVDKFANNQKLKVVTESLMQTIKPEFQYLKALSTRSNTLNVGYVSIFQSLQFLLRTNYQVTIRFLAQLVKSKQPKIVPEDKKKSKRRGNQPGRNSQFSIPDVELCFREDPNLLPSFSDIISIIEEIKQTSKDALAEDIAKWAAKIKIFHKEGYPEWRDKVVNYVKLWDVISDVVTGILPLHEIERHFLILIQLINSLYQKYKTQEDFLQVEKKLLNGLYVLYSMARQSQKNSQINQQPRWRIPRQILSSCLLDYELPTNEGSTYYCFDCGKKVCEECSKVIHAIHDKNYIGQGLEVQCHKMAASKGSQDKKSAKERLIQKMLQESESLDMIERDRELHKLLISQGADKSEIYVRLREQKLLLYKKTSASNQIYQPDDLKFEQQQKPKQYDEEDKLQIRSVSEKQLQIRKFSSVQITPKHMLVLDQVQELASSTPAPINITPLFNLLIRQLKSCSFHTLMASQCDSKNLSSLCEVDMSNQKYTIFKNDIFRYNNQRMNNPGYIGSETATAKRNIIALNDKYIALLSGGFGNQIHYLPVDRLKNSFVRRENEKRYRDGDGLEGMQINSSKINEHSILEVLFSPFSTHLIVEISAQKILFQQASKDGRNRILAMEPSSTGEIRKFQWLKEPDLKNYYSYLSDQVIIGRLGKEKCELKCRINLGSSKIKDYTNTPINSKEIYLTLLDTEGRLFRAKVDLAGRRVPNLINEPVKLNIGETITSLHCQNSTLYCTTQSGKIVIFSINDDNQVISTPFVFPLMEKVASSRIADLSMRHKEISRIEKLKFISRNQNELVLCCLLVRDIPGEQRRSGFFSIISINMKTKKSKVTMFNDQGSTFSCQSLPLNDKEHLFLCMQEDGQFWACKHGTNPSNNRNSLNDFALILSPNDIAKFGEDIKQMKILEQIEFYSSQSRLAFKENPKITDSYRVQTTSEAVQIEVQQKLSKLFFPTGLEFAVSLIAENEPAAELIVGFLDRIYKFEIVKARQIQIPFTLRDALSLFLGSVQFKINFIKGRDKLFIKDINVYGVKSTQKSVYLDALTNICQIVYIYKNISDPIIEKKLQCHLLNLSRNQIMNVNFAKIEEYFKSKNFTLSEQNLFLKLQLLRQSLRTHKLDDSYVSECFDSIRHHVLPNCNERKQLIVSVEKLCRNLSMACRECGSLQMGHALNYKFQLDLYNIFRLCNEFKADATIDTYEELIGYFCTVLNTRTVNSFLILAVYPSIEAELCAFFKKILIDNKIHFKSNENGIQKEDKARLLRICSNMMRIIAENYQLRSNKEKNTNNEQYTLQLLENMFCINKKQVHREVKLNPFKFLESVFSDGVKLTAKPAINFLRLDEVSMEEPQAPILAEQPIANSSEQASHPQPGPSNQSAEDIDNNQWEQSCEEMKDQEEESREMDEEFAYEMPQRAMQNLEKIIDEDEEEEKDSERNEEQGGSGWKKGKEINLKKLYEYLFTTCTSKGPAQMTFHYKQFAESLLIELFQDHQEGQTHKYIKDNNLVFYVGLAYNVLLIIERKLTTLFPYGQIDYSHPYVTGTLSRIIRCIDNKISQPGYSLLYLPIIAIVSANPKSPTSPPKSLFLRCVCQFYSENMLASNLFKCMVDDSWHPFEARKAMPLTSVLSFQQAEVVNPTYQLKFVGCMYLNLRNLGIASISSNMGKIKENIVKCYVKYNLKIFGNIMVIEHWAEDLEKTRLTVAFQQLRVKPAASLKTIIQSIQTDLSTFVQSIADHHERISELEDLLGCQPLQDELILQILDAFYSQGPPN